MPHIKVTGVPDALHQAAIAFVASLTGTNEVRHGVAHVTASVHNEDDTLVYGVQPPVAAEAVPDKPPAQE